MGVPKFYRWISERYPCLSEVIKEYQIPEFDNLYLDMNGIIHTCSHPNDDDPHFRISEEKIFVDIFHYIEFLFKMIKPKKVFFMAIDGVAPRAKMNQQRGRRFRTARDAEILEKKALESGESLPTEARFDSNCITPGTPFMARLNEQLKYFVSMKISTDKLWQDVRVYLSGHETPGEGEHKIMDFIRYEKSQSDYDSNTRHCLYGLDADLIMLGMCSHEPHFSLLREEVKFGGRKTQKRIITPEETTYHLLHLSLLREYLGYEFAPARGKLPFQFDLENIIDDWVLMSFLVGNDFIPHLPNLHIHHDALPILYKAYIEVLPNLGGYINENGYLNLERFEKFLKHLSEYDYQKFSETNPDLRYFENKFMCKSKSSEFSHAHDENYASLFQCAEKLNEIGNLQLDDSVQADSDSPVENVESDDSESLTELEFIQHKRDYYMNKLEYDNLTSDVMKDQAEGYVRAIQWNLHYYYNGIASWSWYYPHHYSPYISDVKDFKNMTLEFDIGKPFLPFQQLLSVLPAASKKLLPESYQELMCNDDSPLKDFYPPDFLTDLNGKQQDWEAIVLIPFINENLLLKCSKEADKNLNSEEISRNKHGPHLLYKYTKECFGSYKTTLSGYFPDIKENHALCKEIHKDFFRLPPECIKKGLCDGVQLDVFFTGFPTLKHLKHTAKLCNEKVRVFQTVSQRDNMMLTITEQGQKNLEQVSNDLIGKIIFVGWPHLQEAFAVAASDDSTQFSLDDAKFKPGNSIKLVKAGKDDEAQSIWIKQGRSVKDYYYERLGVFIGEINILVYAKCFTGSRYVCDVDGNVQQEKQWSETVSTYALQTVVKDIAVHCPQFKTIKTVKELYSIGSNFFMLGQPYYGCMGEITNNDMHENKGRLVINFNIPVEPDLTPVIKNARKLSLQNYKPGYVVAQQLGISSFFLSRLTGTFLIQASPKESMSPNRVNVGLNLKFNKKNEEVSGFSKKNKDGQWLYSEQALRTMSEYLSKFPEFFEKLYKFVEEDIVFLEDLYPDGGGHDVLRNISSWLKLQLCTTAERQVCGINSLDEGVISAIEEIINSTQSKCENQYNEVRVKPHVLYSPFHCKGYSMPDPGTNYQLFDRVINVLYTSFVPLGLRGTIIGIRSSEKKSDYIYEVVFDKEFFGGMSLNCSPGRGYRMSPSGLINISHGERLSRNNNTSVKQFIRNYLESDKTSEEHENVAMNSSSEHRQNIYTGKNSRIRNTLYSTGLQNPILSQSLTDRAEDKKIASQVRILRKSPQQQSAQLQNMPFYRNLEVVPQKLNHSPNSSFTPQKIFPPKAINKAEKQFVTPKANTVYLGPNRNISGVPVQEVPQFSQNSEFHNTWNDLIKKPNTELSSDQLSAHSYGRQVSVEELFHSAQQIGKAQESQGFPSVVPHELSIPSHFQHSAAHKKSNVMELLTYSTKFLGGTPIYTYYKHGAASWDCASVHLPNGKSFSSIPCSNQAEAAENAAEQALASSIAPQQQSHMRPQHKIPVYPQYLPPSCFQSPVPYPPSAFLRFSHTPDFSVVRHPPPPSATLIPDSFVAHNRLTFEGHTPVTQPVVGYQLSPVQNRNSVSSQVTKHTVQPALVDIATEKGATQCTKPGEIDLFEGIKKNSNVFVPLQVTRKTTRKQKGENEVSQTYTELSSSEWPSLPSTGVQETVIPEISGIWQQCQKASISQNSNNTDQFQELSEQNDILSGTQPTESQDSVPSVVHHSSDNKTSQRGRKTRLAANFSNQDNST